MKNILMVTNVRTPVGLVDSIRSIAEVETFYAMAEAEELPDSFFIERVEKKDLIFFIPVDGNLLAKFANGITDDNISKLFAFTTHNQVIIAPSMNIIQLLSCPVERNMKQLEEDQVWILPPVREESAPGVRDRGRLLSNDAIVSFVKRKLS